MAKRSTAIYFAKEAYKSWMYQGRKVAGFDHKANSLSQYRYQSSDKAVYEFKTEGWVVYLRSNGALDKAVARHD